MRLRLEAGAVQRVVAGTGLDTLRNELDRSVAVDGHDTSALGEGFEDTPMVVPGERSFGLDKKTSRRVTATPDEVPDSGLLARAATAIHSRYRTIAISSFRDALLGDRVLYASLWTLSGTRLVCHCRPSEPCHGDVLIEEFKKSFPDAFDRYRDHGVPPDSRILSFMARLREEPESDEGSSPDEGVRPKNSGQCR